MGNKLIFYVLHKLLRFIHKTFWTWTWSSCSAHFRKSKNIYLLIYIMQWEWACSLKGLGSITKLGVPRFALWLFTEQFLLSGSHCVVRSLSLHLCIFCISLLLIFPIHDICDSVSSTEHEHLYQCNKGAKKYLMWIFDSIFWVVLRWIACHSLSLPCTTCQTIRFVGLQGVTAPAQRLTLLRSSKAAKCEATVLNLLGSCCIHFLEPNGSETNPSGRLRMVSSSPSGTKDACIGEWSVPLSWDESVPSWLWTLDIFCM